MLPLNPSLICAIYAICEGLSFYESKGVLKHVCIFKINLLFAGIRIYFSCLWTQVWRIWKSISWVYFRQKNVLLKGQIFSIFTCKHWKLIVKNCPCARTESPLPFQLVGLLICPSLPVQSPLFSDMIWYDMMMFLSGLAILFPLYNIHFTLNYNFIT